MALIEIKNIVKTYTTGEDSFNALNGVSFSIVHVTHEPDITEYCSRIIRFKDGNIVSELPKDEWMKIRNRET